ncbi:hypothetical protein BsWGS_19158 [Bradybaena similaris]
MQSRKLNSIEYYGGDVYERVKILSNANGLVAKQVDTYIFGPGIGKQERESSDGDANKRVEKQRVVSDLDLYRIALSIRKLEKESSVGVGRSRMKMHSQAIESDAKQVDLERHSAEVAKGEREASVDDGNWRVDRHANAARLVDSRLDPLTNTQHIGKRKVENSTVPPKSKIDKFSFSGGIGKREVPPKKDTHELSGSVGIRESSKKLGNILFGGGVVKREKASFHGGVRQGTFPGPEHRIVSRRIDRQSTAFGKDNFQLRSNDDTEFHDAPGWMKLESVNNWVGRRTGAREINQ